MKSRSVLAMVVLLGMSASNVSAQRMEAAPSDLREVEIIEKRGDLIPLDLPFVDSNGEDLVLGDLFDGTRPVILTLNYSNCPMLCSLQLNGMLDGLKGMKWNLGDEYQIITVSIDPTETPQRAQLTKQKYLKLYGRPGVASGWRFLTGKEANIRRLANDVGFGYTYVESSGEYAHAAAAILLTPDGQISRYLYGVEYDPQTMRLSLVESGEGKIGSAMDQILLFCFHYDATKGRYGPAAEAVMRVGGVLTIFGLAGMVFVFWRRGSMQQTETPPQDPAKETQTEAVG